MVTPLPDFGDTGVEFNVRTFRTVQEIADLLVVRFENDRSVRMLKPLSLITYLSPI